MGLARLLPTLVFLSSLTVTAQDHQGIPCCGPPVAPIYPFNFDFGTPAATASETWRIIPNAPLVTGSQRAPLNDHRNYPSLADNTCYAIRTYVVARDEKDSDSTHPVRSSTCQRANRYHLKNADAHPNLSDR